MTTYSWFRCGDCAWVGRTSELRRVDGDQHCPNCNIHVEAD